jgi:hypothetical protein
MLCMILIKCQEQDMNKAIRLYDKKELILFLILCALVVFLMNIKSAQNVTIKTINYTMSDSTWDNFYPNK